MIRYLQVPDSEIIDAVGYDSNKQELHVSFKASPTVVYQYDCEPTIFAWLVSAESIGKAFHERFKKSKFTKSERQKPTLKK